MTPPQVKDRLWPLMRRKRAARLWVRLALCWLVGCFAGLGFILSGVFLGGLPAAVLPVILLLSVTAAGVIWLRHCRKRHDWLGCARELEGRFPELDGRLLTAVEQKPEPNGQFSYLQRRLIDEVISHDRRVRWDSVFPRSRVGLIKLTHALAFAAFCITCLRLGTLQQETLGGANAAGGVVITPGDASLERGSSLVVMVRFNAKVPSSVDLVVRQSGRPVQRIPLGRSLEDPIFGGSVAEVSDDLEYAVEYGRRRSRDFKVTVFDYPRLERSDVDLVYPDYTALAPKHIEDTRRVSAVTGTQLDLTLQLNKPVARALLVPRNEDADVIALELQPERPEVRLTGFTLLDSERYALHLVDADGRTNKQSVHFAFNVLSNRVPEIQITAPRGDIRPSALEEVNFAGTVFDDFGVLAYGLAYIVSGQEMTSVELGTQVPAKEKQSFEHVIPFEELGLQPDDLVSWFFWSEDIGPDGEIRRTMGDLYFAEVRPFEEIFRQGQSQFGQTGGQQQQGGGGGGQTARLAELQQQIIHATWKLQREHGMAGSRKTSPPQSSIHSDRHRGFASQRTIEPESLLLRGQQPLKGFLREMLDSSAKAFGNSPGLFAQRTPGNGGAQTSRSERPTVSDTADLFTQDVQVVVEAQQEALAQAEEALSRQEDPLQIAQWGDAVKQMESALRKLTQATNSPATLQEALIAQQAAYQRLLKLQEHEYSVSRNQSQSGNQSGRQQQLQRQLDQMELTSEENRYETERLAQAPQSAEQREQLQVMSRLAELARRQQDINERLQELQTALEAAQTEEAREQLRKELKRLQDEQRQMLADVDELQQRMQSEENQSQFSEQQQQLEQTRESVQRAAEAAQEGSVSQALAAGTRAQRAMEQMREELRNQSASAFAEDMRQMRAEARELSRQQEELQNQIEDLSSRENRSLSDSRQTLELRDRLAQQREHLTNLVAQATEVSQLAEEAEPLMSNSLYETLREFSQDDLGTVKQVQEELLANGMYSLYQRLKGIAEDSEAKTLDMTSEMLGEGLPELAVQTGQRAQQDIEDLARGIERAAELVLGDDTEALRMAESELEDLSKQLQEEIARESRAQTNATGLASGNSTQQSSEASGSQEQQPGEQANGTGGEPQESQAQSGAPGKNNLPGNSGETQSGQLAQGRGENQGEGESNQQRAGNPGNGGQGAPANAEGSSNSNQQANGGSFDFDQFLGGAAGGRTGGTGPITGNDFGPWSDRLRQVEELVELPSLRNELIRAREQARQVRRDYTRNRQKPDWAQVRIEVVEPLVEVRQEIGEELARRQSRESLVPIDRDPVPDRYSELVRRYYEELGRDRD